MYMFHVYWISIHMHHASKCLNIMFLYLEELWTKRIFYSKSKFLVFGKNDKTQK